MSKDKFLQFGCLFDWYHPVKGMKSGKKIVAADSMDSISKRRRKGAKVDNIVWDALAQCWVFTSDE